MVVMLAIVTIWIVCQWSADRQRDVRLEETMSRTIIVLILGLTLSACQGQRFNSSSVGGGITHQSAVVGRG
jgi:ABC-type amino acid transport system permease subunit